MLAVIHLVCLTAQMEGKDSFYFIIFPQKTILEIKIDNRSDQGLVKGTKLCLNPYFFWLAGEVSWLAVEVLSPCQI